MRRFGMLWVVAALLAGVTLQCGEDNGPGPGLSIVPDSVDLEVSSSQQFAVDLDGSSPVANWYVDGVRGGAPATGMISKSGFYVAPSAVPASGVVTVMARVASDATQEQTAEVRITKLAESVYVTVAPETSTVMAADSVVFSRAVFGCSSDSVTWSFALIWGGLLDRGEITSDGVYHAPATPSASFGLMINALSWGCPEKTGIAQVVVYVPTSEFSIELEQFSETHNLGGLGISASYCGGASGGKQVTGLDVAGEWIRVPIHVPVSGTYEVSLRYQANGDSPILEAIAIEGLGDPPPETSFSLMQGGGIG